ncbi:unnamed protein product, partial [Sphacelaria rigidula]
RLYQDIKSLVLEGSKQSDSNHVRSATGKLLGDMRTILQRWNERFKTLLNASSPAIDDSIIDLIGKMLEHAPLSAEPSMAETTGAMGKLANGKPIGACNNCGEPLNVG